MLRLALVALLATSACRISLDNGDDGDDTPDNAQVIVRPPLAWLLALLACGAVGWSIPEAVGQPPGLNPNRDCQTLLTCRYTRGGIYRGCLSSYSCRVCRLVSARCRIDSSNRVCRQMRCVWG